MCLYLVAVGSASRKTHKLHVNSMPPLSFFDLRIVFDGSPFEESSGDCAKVFDVFPGYIPTNILGLPVGLKYVVIIPTPTRRIMINTSSTRRINANLAIRELDAMKSFIPAPNFPLCESLSVNIACIYSIITILYYIFY